MADFLHNFDVKDHAVNLILVFTFVFCLAYYALQNLSLFHKLPPGPYGLPIVGYMPFLGNEPHKTFIKLGAKYGDVFRIQLGTTKYIVLNSYEAIREAFIKQSNIFSGRPDWFPFNVFEDERMFSIMEGQDWKEIRTFTMNSLRKLGFGTKSIQPQLQNEMTIFLEELEKQNGQPYDISTLFTTSVGNAITTLLNGERSEYNDPWLIDMVKSIMDIQETYVYDLSAMIPILKKLPIQTSNSKRQVKLKLEIWRLVEEKVQARVKTHNEGDDNSFIDMWLTEFKRRKGVDDELYSLEYLKYNVDLLLQASFETTSTTLTWAVFYLMANPEIQQKLHDEIDDVLGPDRRPSMEDLQNMPYLQAFIQELLRVTSIVPLSVFHCNTEATTLMDLYIPKRTVIIPNLYAVHYNEKVFPEPEVMRPERFIDENGKFIRSEQVIQFSVGKRVCPGEAVARLELFTYLACSLQKFTFKAPIGQKIMRRPDKTTILGAPPFKTCVILRHH